MVNRKIFIALFYLMLGLFFSSCVKEKPLKTTYLGNCSYLYESADSKVLIDPLGTDFGSYFHLPSKAIQQKIMDDSMPFNDINIMLITHIHGDHFNWKLAEEYLLKHPEIAMICPTQVRNQMRDSSTIFDKIENQLISPELERFSDTNLVINQINIQVIRMQHGAQRSLDGIEYSDYNDYEKTEDFGYVISMNGHRIFHQGDGSLKLNEAALKNINQPIELGYLSFFDWDSTSLAIEKNQLGAKQVVFMHGTIPGEELKSEEFKTIRPELLFFSNEMECKVFN